MWPVSMYRYQAASLKKLHRSWRITEKIENLYEIFHRRHRQRILVQ